MANALGSACMVGSDALGTVWHTGSAVGSVANSAVGTVANTAMHKGQKLRRATVAAGASVSSAAPLASVASACHRSSVCRSSAGKKACTSAGVSSALPADPAAHRSGPSACLATSVDAGDSSRTQGVGQGIAPAAGQRRWRSMKGRGRLTMTRASVAEGQSRSSPSSKRSSGFAKKARLASVFAQRRAVKGGHVAISVHEERPSRGHGLQLQSSQSTDQVECWT